MNLLEHYKKLWFFNFNRLKGHNYRLLREYYARIFIEEVEEFMSLSGSDILDVGGARGEFCNVIENERQCRAFNIDPDPFEHGSYSTDFIWPKTVIASACEIPFDRGKFDCVICRGVIEHIPFDMQQEAMDEIYRVLKPGGICYLMVPPWYSPHGGHDLKPFHYFPFRFAKFMRQLVFRKKIKGSSYADRSLYPVTFSRTTGLCRESGFLTLGTRDLHFRLHFLTNIPLLREILVPAAVFILKK